MAAPGGGALNPSERVAVAFRRMLDGEPVTPAALALATGSSREACAATLEVLREHVPCVRARGVAAGWALAGPVAALVREGRRARARGRPKPTPEELHAAFVSGESPTAIARRTGVARDTLVRRVVEFAAERGLPDPTEERDRRAYALRERGLAWAEIASVLGFFTAQAAMTGAERHARDHARPWPLKAEVDPDGLARAAFELREQGEHTWAAIATIVGFNSPHAAYQAARRHAGRRDAPASEGAAPAPTELDLAVRRRRAYERALDGAPWDLVAEEVGFPSPAEARGAARELAAQHGLPWPAVPDGGDGWRARLAYDLRARGLAWTAVARVAGYPSVQTGKRRVVAYAERSGSPAPR